MEALRASGAPFALLATLLLVFNLLAPLVHRATAQADPFGNPICGYQENGRKGDQGDDREDGRADVRCEACCLTLALTGPGAPQSDETATRFASVAFTPPVEAPCRTPAARAPPPRGPPSIRL